MKYYYRHVSARTAVNRFGKLDFVTRTEYFKTNSAVALAKANKGLRIKFEEIDTTSRGGKELVSFLRKSEKDFIYFDDMNCYYGIDRRGFRKGEIR